MDLLLLTGVAVGLSMDAFAVAIAVSVTLGCVTKRQLFRLSFHLGLFQGFMPVIGWLAGRGLVDYIAAWDHWVAFGLLAFVGGREIWGAFTEEETPDDPCAGDPTRGMNLMVLSVATSIDALAVGLSFGALGVSVWYPSVFIGCVTGALTLTAMLIGSKLGRRFGARAQFAGGLVLIGIGLKILAEHLPM